MRRRGFIFVSGKDIDNKQDEVRAFFTTIEFKQNGQMDSNERAGTFYFGESVWFDEVPDDKPANEYKMVYDKALGYDIEKVKPEKSNGT